MSKICATIDNNCQETEAAAFACGEICRIGGLSLTQNALELCGLKPPALVADIGCGQGATVRYLRNAGFTAFGLDSQAATLDKAGEHCQQGEATALPYANAGLDGLLFECSLSQVADKELALAEAARVLKVGGQLVISDLYARNEGHTAAPPSKAEWLGLLQKAGFGIRLFRDESVQMKNLYAQVIWEYGQEVWAALCGHTYSPEALKAAHCGYFLLLAEKPLIQM